MRSLARWHVGLVVVVLGQLLLFAPGAAQPLEGDRRREAEEAERLRDLFLRQEKIIIGKGQFLLELDALYSSDRRTGFVLLDSQAAVARVTQRAFDTSVTARYGLLDGLEAVLQVPFFVHAEQDVDLGVSRVDSASDGIGDVGGLVRYQLLTERGGWPDVILDVNAKSRTAGDSLRGTGHWHVGAGVTLVKTIDPVVFFGRIGYTETLDRRGVDPGNVVEYRLGMGFSLNDRVSFNMQVSGARVGRTSLRGRDVRGSSLDVISLLFATTVLATKQLYIEPVVGVGLTDDAPDAIVGIRLPYRF